MNYDFSGWAATNNVRCSDNTIIRPGAFKDNDGMTVPLVWQHSHDNPSNVLGHAVLKNSDPKGTYMFGYLNNSEEAQHAKESIIHGDIKAISIFANQLKRHKTPEGDEILHGNIREVSLVLAGADPGAFIDYIRHSDDGESDEAIIYNNAEIVLEDFVQHEDDETTVDEVIDSMTETQQTVLKALVGEAYAIGQDDSSADQEEDSMNDQYDDTEVTEETEEVDDQVDVDDDVAHADDTDDDETVEDVINGMNEKQQTVLKALMGKAYEKGQADAGAKTDDEDDESEGDKNMKHDVFDNNDGYVGGTLSHADLDALCQVARDDVRNFGGSFKDSFIAHAENDYGIGNIDLLFPDAKAIDSKPEFIQRQMEWVTEVIGKTRHLPYTRIKSLFADITADEARAKGYITGKLKKEEFFALAKRETTPTTVYKKQRLDRDNILDATTIDVVNWVWGEMRLMLNEEIARAILLGDGREVSSTDKIPETNIRPIATDAELFTVAELVTSLDARDLVEEMAKKHKNYRGSGAPVMFMGVETHTDMLWVKDELGRKIYTSDAELCSALRVSKIVEVPLMDDFTKAIAGRTDIADGTYKLLGLKVNLSDYATGTDKGGEITSFDDFDIDYNQFKYLLETRMSGALVKYHGAQAFWQTTNAVVTPEDDESGDGE